MAIVSLAAIVSKLSTRRILENSWLLPNLVKQCLKFDIGICGVTDTEDQFSTGREPFTS